MEENQHEMLSRAKEYASGPMIKVRSGAACADGKLSQALRPAEQVGKAIVIRSVSEAAVKTWLALWVIRCCQSFVSRLIARGDLQPNG